MSRVPVPSGPSGATAASNRGNAGLGPSDRGSGAKTGAPGRLSRLVG